MPLSNKLSLLPVWRVLDDAIIPPNDRPVSPQTILDLADTNMMVYT